ncbi:hypothetical protein GIB67_022255 [Kingdonia uniflora]|uniref:TGS domain-containing protein n=1 Tax=Kingdonia uniflora TaxID=39325 RepID=A0A7J7M6Z0_9MAGN|nr:hypothetical protein GIB67_022255 [Kingdonia uniflora]
MPPVPQYFDPNSPLQQNQFPRMTNASVPHRGGQVSAGVPSYVSPRPQRSPTSPQRPRYSGHGSQQRQWASRNGFSTENRYWDDSDQRGHVTDNYQPTPGIGAIRYGQQPHYDFDGKSDADGFIDWLNRVDKMLAFKYIGQRAVTLVNMNERDYQRKKNKFLPKIHAWVQEHGANPILPFSCILERNLADMPDDEAAKYCEENKVQSALTKIIKTGFSAINLIYFFTAGPDEVKCWQIRRHTKAPQAAGAIHTDFEKGFICAEVMKFEDLKGLGSESAVKAAGKYKQEGKTYVVQDGDIIFFKFNVSGGGKK